MPVRSSMVQRFSVCLGSGWNVGTSVLQCIAVCHGVLECVAVCVLSGANADAHAHASRALECALGASGREGKGCRCSELGVGGQDIATS